MEENKKTEYITITLEEYTDLIETATLLATILSTPAYKLETAVEAARNIMRDIVNGGGSK